jgi:hypothetical protein
MTRRDAIAVWHYAEIVYEMVETLSAHVTPAPLAILSLRAGPYLSIADLCGC